MDESRIGDGSHVVARRRKSTSSRSSGKRCAIDGGPVVDHQAATSSSSSAEGNTGIISNGTPSPCGACKFLRRKCVSGCIFAPYFGSDRGAAKFAAVHKVFGASNVSKLLLYIPVNRRHDAVVTISYEAQARLSDPVYGCVSTIIALQQQVATLQSELGMVQTQLMNSRFALTNAFQGSQTMPQQQQQQNNILSMLQPAYSNTSSISNNNYNFVNFSNFNSISGGSFDLVGETVISGCFDPIHELPPTTPLEDEDEEDSHIPISFTNQIF